MKIITIATNGVIEQMEISGNGVPLYNDVRNVIGGHIENVHPMRLPKNLIMVVNEGGKCIGLPVNHVASYLYGTDIHGDPIVGNVVILKDGVYANERDIVGIPDVEANTIMNDLLKTIFSITKNCAERRKPIYE